MQENIFSLTPSEPVTYKRFLHGREVEPITIRIVNTLTLWVVVDIYAI